MSWHKINRVYKKISSHTVLPYLQCSHKGLKKAITYYHIRRHNQLQTHRCFPRAAWEPWDSWAKRWHGWAESRTVPPGWTSPGGWLCCHWPQNSRRCSSTLDFQRIPRHWSLQHLKQKYSIRQFTNSLNHLNPISDEYCWCLIFNPNTRSTCMLYWEKDRQMIYLNI